MRDELSRLVGIDGVVVTGVVESVGSLRSTDALLVVLCACEERLLPSWRSLASPDPNQLEEPRRPACRPAGLVQTGSRLAA